MPKAKTIMQIAKQYCDRTTEEDFFDYIVESYENGQYQQAQDMFRAMEHHQRKTMLIWMLNAMPTGHHSKQFIHFFSLL